jgi:flagellar assembly protein FliH
MTDNKDEFQNWSIPDLSESDEQPEQENSLFGKPATWYTQQNKEVEEVEVEEQPKPLTLDDIEAVRQSAYDDGFNEGKENGHIKGLEEGKLEGLATGHEEGLKQGIEEGLAQGKEEVDQQIATWKSLIERLHFPLEKLDDNAEYQLVRLATSLAEQITRCEVQTSPQIILQALKQAVEALPISEQKLIIHLHPDDLEFVNNAYSQEQCIQRGWDLQAEPALMRGDCQIHTQVSSVDSTFNTRIEQVLKSFFKDNHNKLPEKNDDSNLVNDQPVSPQSKPSETPVNDAQAVTGEQETSSENAVETSKIVKPNE